MERDANDRSSLPAATTADDARTALSAEGTARGVVTTSDGAAVVTSDGKAVTHGAAAPVAADTAPVMYNTTAPNIDRPAIAAEPAIRMPLSARVDNEKLCLEVALGPLAHGGFCLGGENRVYAGSDVLQSQVSAGVDLNERHIGPAADVTLAGGQLLDARGRVGITPGADRAALGARADVGGLGGALNVGGGVGVEAGSQRFGPYADGRAALGPIGAKAAGSAYLTEGGPRVNLGAGAGIETAIGAEGQARAALGTENGLNVNGRLIAGRNNLDAGVGFFEPNARPDAYVRAQGPNGESGAALYPARTWQTQNAGADSAAREIPLNGGAAAQAGVEVRAVQPQARIESRPLPPVENQNMRNGEYIGGDGLTMTERAAKVQGERSDTARGYGAALGQMMAQGASARDILQAAFRGSQESVHDNYGFMFRDASGRLTRAEVKVSNYGLNDSVTIYGYDAQGRRQVLMRGVHLDNGQMVQQRGKDGQPVAFETAAARTMRGR